jgi:hypothetical protein
MEYVPGVTLDRLLHKHGRLSADRLAPLLGQLCHALDAAHRHGIVHHDLKPANLMVVAPDTPEESLRVMDFGLAQLAVRPHIPLEKLTGSGPVYASGTPAYICPEKVRGDESDHRGDIYSVGVVLYEALTGRLPFDAPTVPAILERHVHATPPRFATAGAADVPAAVEAVVAGCLAKYPNERPQTAWDLAQVYGTALDRDVWRETAPPGEVDLDSPEAVVPTPSPTISQGGLGLIYELEAWMPERVAVVKLRGFVEDLGGRVIESVPGLVRVRLHEPVPPPPPPRGLLAWLAKIVPPDKPPPPPPRLDPIELELHMVKRDTGPGNHLHITAHFHPVDAQALTDPHEWRERCEQIRKQLRAYLIV